ncbi:c-type cytochrome [Campylobacterota bacterium]
MKKKLLLLPLLTFMLLAEEEPDFKAGQKVFDNVCSSCHVELLDKNTALKTFKTLKAPPMNEVAQQIKTNIIIKDDDDDVHRAVVIAFIKDYIKHPELAKVMCNPPAVDRFGLMPSQKAVLSDDEIDSVSTWLYDRYEGVEF